jgi:hypothetical protein
MWPFRRRGRVVLVEPDPAMAEFNRDDWRVSLFNCEVYVPNGVGLWDQAVFRHAGGFCSEPMWYDEVARREDLGTLWPHLESQRQLAEARWRHAKRRAKLIP